MWMINEIWNDIDAPKFLLKLIAFRKSSCYVNRFYRILNWKIFQYILSINTYNQTFNFISNRCNFIPNFHFHAWNAINHDIYLKSTNYFRIKTWYLNIHENVV